MKKRAFAALLVISLICALIAGCSQQTGESSREPSKPADKSEPANTPSQTQAPAEAAKECDWTLHVDDTVPVTSSDGITINYTLIIDAVKKGGKDDLGTYTGSASISMKLDTSKLPSTAVKISGLVDEYLKAKTFSFVIVSYDEEKYSSFDSGNALAPLTGNFNGMALISTPMEADGAVDLAFSGMRGEKGNFKDNNNGTYTVNMSMTLEAGKVQVNIPGLKINKYFSGILTGTPVS